MCCNQQPPEQPPNNCCLSLSSGKSRISLVLLWCPEGDLNPHGGLAPADFKSAASADFAIRACAQALRSAVGTNADYAIPAADHGQATPIRNPIRHPHSTLGCGLGCPRFLNLARRLPTPNRMAPHPDGAAQRHCARTQASREHACFSQEQASQRSSPMPRRCPAQCGLRYRISPPSR